ncbi:hypothetical protein [Paracoccus aminovorans]|uniref:hypothetical protein n=1 Tax=Paracoccus aminovorans TaxID=34004 RepID=UPI000786691F|nr:hypothetical protein [Paracoccus aminovorans]MDQ7775243.1 hypothetical protein [Paracoccus aminovorans]MDQ7776268.1 hypothetical protein [Paracoccus aminovorans]
MPPTNETVQAIGAGIAAFLIALGTWWGTKKGDGKPPADRAPAPHEVKEAIADLRKLIEDVRESLDNHDDDHRQIARQLDRIENRLQITNEVQHWRDRTIPPR